MLRRLSKTLSAYPYWKPWLDGATGYLLRDPMNHVELAELVRRLAGDRSGAQKLGAAAAQYVQASVSWDHNTSATRKFLEDSIASSQI